MAKKRAIRPRCAERVTRAPPEEATQRTCLKQSQTRQIKTGQARKDTQTSPVAATPHSRPTETEHPFSLPPPSSRVRDDAECPALRHKRLCRSLDRNLVVHVVHATPLRSCSGAPRVGEPPWRLVSARRRGWRRTLLQRVRHFQRLHERHGPPRRHPTRVHFRCLLRLERQRAPAGPPRQRGLAGDGRPRARTPHVAPRARPLPLASAEHRPVDRVGVRRRRLHRVVAVGLVQLTLRGELAGVGRRCNGGRNEADAPACRAG